jgi:hypothetical protein
VNVRTLSIVALLVLMAAAAVFLMTPARPRPEAHETAPPAIKESAPPPAAAADPPRVDTPVTAAPARPPSRREPAAKPAPASTAEAPAPAEASPTAGILHIESDVPGAQVFIDRQFIGVTPITASDVKPGSHRLNVSAQGYEGVADTIEVAPGPRNIQIRLKDVRLDVKIDVVHKHRIGSCKGRLVATPQGLRYETSNKDDAFSVALLDLGTFQIDYLEKNLRVAARSGKRYDFTDPDGNADRLFVFHRDVDKARERLRNGDPPAAR